MRKYILMLIAAITAVACGGTYSVASGRDDAAQLTLTAEKTYSIQVVVDGTTYNMETVKQKAYKQRKMKATANNTITITTGQHKVDVLHDGNKVYSKQVFVTSGQHKVIEL